MFFISNALQTIYSESINKPEEEVHRGEKINGEPVHDIPSLCRRSSNYDKSRERGEFHDSKSNRRIQKLKV